MDGINTMEWNGTTMKAAIQHYLDECILRAGLDVEVTDVKSNGSNGTFTITIRKRTAQAV